MIQRNLPQVLLWGFHLGSDFPVDSHSQGTTGIWEKRNQQEGEFPVPRLSWFPVLVAVGFFLPQRTGNQEGSEPSAPEFPEKEPLEP